MALYTVYGQQLYIIMYMYFYQLIRLLICVDYDKYGAIRSVGNVYAKHVIFPPVMYQKII